MKYMYENIKIVLCLSMIFIFQNKIDAQSSISQKLLIRDSLDFVKKSISNNSIANDYNPIPYKGGLIYISNKKTKNNPLGFNKVYWLADTSMHLLGNDSVDVLRSKFNDDFTAPTSNDNNILTHYTRRKDLTKLNSVERFFSDFNPDGSFTINDTTNEVFYSKISSRKINGAYRWELWHAQLKDGKLYHENRLSVKNDTANYTYPHLTNNGNTLLYSSNKVGGKGGYDIYAFEKKDNVWVMANKENFTGINTNSNEISPSTINSSLAEIFYASDKEGGMGGYDIYKYARDINVNLNLGYPINTINDETSLNAKNNNFFTTSKNKESVDISIINYKPISINIQGRVNYAIDTSIVAGKKLYITDVDANKVIDSILTDEYAKFSFVGKPNRHYLINSFNDDLIKQSFEINTNSNTSKTYYQALSFNGSSPKQKIDSINKLLAAIELQKLDSIKGYINDNKFVVYYDFDKSYLRKNELSILDSLIIILNNHPTKTAVVGAFTDCLGSYKYNYNLSVKRANTVVAYLIKHGVAKSRIIGNGYSENYNITPCITGVAKNKKLQINNRRSEIVLSDNNKNDWAALEKQRGNKFYAVYSVANIKNTNITFVNKHFTSPKKLSIIVKKDSVVVAKASVAKKDTALVAKVIKPIVKKDSVIVAKVPVVAKKDTALVAKVIKPIVKKDSVVVAKVPVVAKKDTALVAKVIKPIVKKDSVVVAKVPVVAKKDTALIAKAIKPIVKKDSVVVAKVPVVAKKDTALIAKTMKPIDKKDSVVFVKAKKDKILVASSANYENDELSKAEIIKALDSLASLKREQERIVEYLTKRINKKPIDVFVSSDSVTVEIYDNAIHDKDSVSIIYNNRIIVDRQELKVNHPIKFSLKVDKNKKLNELVMVAENLGSEPPNTAVMFVTEKSGRRQQIMLSTDMTHNEVVYFIRIGKE